MVKSHSISPVAEKFNHRMRHFITLYVRIPPWQVLTMVI